MDNRAVATAVVDEMMSDIGDDLPPWMAQTLRAITMDAFLSQGTSSKGAPNEDAAQAYHRAWSKNHDDEYISGMPKPPATVTGSNAFDMNYDGGGNLSSATGAGYVFEIQRDSAGKMMRVVAKPQ